MHMPSPGLPEFDYVRPDSLDKASRLLAQHGDKARPFMGGTDIFVRMRDGFLRPETMVDVKHLRGMQSVAYDGKAGLTIGAATTLNEIARHPDVRSNYPLLAEAANAVASYQLRNRATLGGNLCNASPAADTAPAALLLEGSMVLYGPAGRRAVAADEFFLGPGATVIEPGELMTAISFPIPPVGHVAKYLKLGRNKAGDLAIAGVAVLGFPSETARGHGFRVAMASVAPVPLRAHGAERVLATRPPGEETFALAAREAMKAAAPISDVRASAVYRKEMVRALTLRGLREVWAQLKEGR